MYEDFGVDWKPAAKDDLEAIVQYIADQGEPIAAARLKKKILSEVAKLSYSPYRVLYNKKSGLRKCNVGSYIIFFVLDENSTPKRVAITQIIHGKRNLRRWVR